MRKFLRSYGKLDTATPVVDTPKTLDQLRELLTHYDAEKRKVTVRAGGYSFDSQALNDDVVILLSNFNQIKSFDETNADRPTITVEPAVTWKTILKKSLERGLTCPVVVTSGEVTAGGTLSSNCLSRNSIRYGTQGNWVEHFSLLTVKGEIILCSPTENRDVFYAVIGGYGFLGVVIEITYRLIRVDKQLKMMTRIKKYDNFEEIVAELRRGITDINESEEWDGIYALAFFTGKTNKGYVFHSKYTTESNLHRLLLYSGWNWFLVPVAWMMRFVWINRVLLEIVFNYLANESKTYIDNFFGYTFFMDNHRIAKEIPSRIGIQLPSIQQTFFIPEHKVLNFLTLISVSLRDKKLSPTMFDILYIPKDDFVLSAWRSTSGFAVSVAFEDSSRAQNEKTIQELILLSTVCKEMNGHVTFIKDVHCSSTDLKEMYGDSFEEFLTIKKQLDPNNTLTNRFFDKLFH